MSAFVVAPGTIDDVVSAAYGDHPTDQPILFGGRQYKSASHLGRALYRLNKESIRRLYGDTYGPSRYEHQADDQGAVQRYKSVRCFLYQACEGGCDSTPLYKAVEQVKRAYERSLALPRVFRGKESWSPPGWDEAVWDRDRAPNKKEVAA